MNKLEERLYELCGQAINDLYDLGSGNAIIYDELLSNLLHKQKSKIPPNMNTKNIKDCNCVLTR